MDGFLFEHMMHAHARTPSMLDNQARDIDARRKQDLFVPIF